ESIKSKFLPATDYARAKSVDWAKMESVQNAFTERYLAEVR
ncbi:MAG: ABC transporter substrate-binding protein, partial [Xanthobacteraceae bacterium]